jgi:predicted DNA binding CopG/RHH family protein
MKTDKTEQRILESIERGEWRSKKGTKRERSRYARYAGATLGKDRRVTIRISSKDLEAIKRRAAHDELPYLALISNVLHEYATGRLRER